MQATYRRTPWTTALAACVLAGSGVAFAGEALPEELPSMRTPVPAMSAPATRAEVRAELANARDAGIVTPSGEQGDTPQVLAARERFNARQSEELIAMYEVQAEEQRVAALQNQPSPADDASDEPAVDEMLIVETVPVDVVVIPVDPADADTAQ